MRGPGFAWWTLARGAIRAAVLLLVVLAAVTCLPAGSESLDPLPLRRVLVPPDRVAAELARVKQGTMVSMPRAKFEALVRQAAESGTARRADAHLVKARYWARLDGAALVGGGDWTVVNPSPGPAHLSLPDLRFAVHSMKIDGGDAVLGELDGKDLALRVEKTGQQSVFFDWSLRGRSAVGAFQFDLRTPACAAATLELTLPTEYVVTVGRAAALTGPDFAGNPALRLWRLDFAGRAQVNLVLHRTSGPGAVSDLVLARTTARQQLFPDHVDVKYDVDLEVLHNTMQTLTFDCDPSLQPTEVTFRGLPIKDLEWQPPPAMKEAPSKGGKTGATASAVLIVRLREPVEQGPQPTLRIACQAPLPADRSWVSPWLRLRQAVPRGETLELMVHPDLQLAEWDPGGFRIIRAATNADGFQVLKLTDGGAFQAVRPSARLQPGGTEVMVRQTSWWQVGAHEATLTSELTYEVTRGTLFQLAVKLPPSGKDLWQLEAVEVASGDLLRDWVTVTDKGRSTLLVELKRALTVGDRASLALRLRQGQNRASPTGTLNAPFPDLEPAERCHLAGTLGVSVDPLYRIDAAPASVDATDPESVGPWGSTPLQLCYVYRDESPTGQLRLLPHRPVIHARCVNEVLVAGGRATLAAHVTLDPVIGAPDSVDLYLSAPSDGKWKIDARPGLIRGLERLPTAKALPALLLLGGRDGPGKAAALAAPPRGEYWRLTLARPLTRREVFSVETSIGEPEELLARRPPLIDPDPLRDLHGQGQIEVPLLTVPGADRMEGEVILQLVGAELLDAKAENLQETGREGTAPAKAAAALPGSGQDVWRTFRFGHSSLPGQGPRLRLRSRPVEVMVSDREVCDFSRLTTRLEPDGRLLHRFTFQVRSWRKRTLPLQLPAGADILSARVEDCWVEVLSKVTAEGVRLELPVPAAAVVAHCEVVYATRASWPAWVPWARLDSPAPELPVPPVVARRTWQLPPGLVPLSPASQQRLPEAGTALHSDRWWAELSSGWRVGQSALAAAGPPFSGEEWALRQQQELTAAAAEVGKQVEGGGWRLGQALDRLAVDHLKDSLPLVIDAAALRAAGLGPDTPCPVAGKRTSLAAAAPFWIGLDLVHVPCSGGALLTTQRQWKLWQGLAGESRLKGDAVDEAVRQAVAHGHDVSGRFHSVASWLRRAAHEGNVISSGPRSDPFRDKGQMGWTEWEPLAGTSGDVGLVVVRQQAFHVVGLALGGLLVLLAWRARKSLTVRWRFRLLLAWLGLAGLALLWLPGALRPVVWWPAASGLAVALVWYILGPATPGSRVTATSSAAGAAAAPLAALCLCLLGGSSVPVSSAGSVEPWTVLILPGSQPEGPVVLVGEALLKKLDALTRQDGPKPEAVLLGARYEGSVSGARADFKAEFLVYCPAGKTTVKVPLTGVELKEGALLEGVFVNPSALPGELGGYAVQVTSEKPQVVKLTLPFSVGLTTMAEQYELEFHIPRLAQSQLSLTLPIAARGVQVVRALGQEQVQMEGSQLRVKAQLGFADLLPLRDSAIHVRWRQPNGPGPTPTVHVKEYYLWDVRLAASSLTAVLRYSVSSGAVADFAIELPEGLDVRSVEVTTQASTPKAAGLARLRTWEVSGKGAGRHLLLQLKEPASGDVQVTLGLLPRLALMPGVASLPLPAPARPLAQKEKGATGLLAYRVEGLEAADKTLNLGIVGIPFEQFMLQWSALGMRSAASREATATRAYSFRRAAPGAALELSLSLPRPEATSKVSWRVYPGHADLQATVEVASASAKLNLVEWEVPPFVTVAQVTGKDVGSWTRFGGRVLIWLREPRREKTLHLQLTGWVRPNPGGNERFVLPLVRLLSSVPGHAEVQLTAAGALNLKEESLANLTAIAGPASLSYRVQDPKKPAYGASFRVHPTAAEIEAKALTCLEVRDGAVTLSGYLDLDLPPGQPRTLQVRLTGWPGEEVRLEAPRAVDLREVHKGPDRTWTVTLPPGLTRRYVVKLTGKIALPPGGRLAAPALTLPGTKLKDRWVAIVGLGLRAEGKDSRGLAVVKDGLSDLAVWPGQAEAIRREGMVWKVEADDWRLSLAVKGPGGSPTVTLLLAEQDAAIADGQHWLHEGTYLLTVQGGADLHVRLPDAARALAVTLDSNPVVPRPLTAQHLWLPLPGRPGLHVLHLRWAYAGGAETLDQPMLKPVRFDGVAESPVLWTVHIPAGQRLARRKGAGPTAASLSTAAVEMHRAGAYLRLSQLLSERRQDRPGETVDAQLLAAQKLFYGCCKRAAEDLVVSPHAAADVGPDGQSLPQWLEHLTRQNQDLARTAAFAGLRAEAEKTPDMGPQGAPLLALGDSGTPLRWQTGVHGDPPQATLQPVAEQQKQEVTVATELLLVLLLSVWIFSHLPRLAALLRWLWPEQLLVLTLLGWHGFGPSVVGVLLLVAAAGGRLVLLVLALRRLLRPRHAAPAS